MPVAVKRVYESASPSDGVRVLVDRLWPRGLRKNVAHEWFREVAPSDALRKWYHAQPELWMQFQKKYLEELARPEKQEDLMRLHMLSRKRKRLTLLFASKNVEHNNATVLRDLLERMRKPPTGTGPSGLRSVHPRGAAAMRRR